MDDLEVHSSLLVPLLTTILNSLPLRNTGGEYIVATSVGMSYEVLRASRGRMYVRALQMEDNGTKVE